MTTLYGIKKNKQRGFEFIDTQDMCLAYLQAVYGMSSFPVERVGYQLELSIVELTEYNGWVSYETWATYTGITGWNELEVDLYDYINNPAFDSKEHSSQIYGIETIISHHINSGLKSKVFNDKWQAKTLLHSLLYDMNCYHTAENVAYLQGYFRSNICAIVWSEIIKSFKNQ